MMIRDRPSTALLIAFLIGFGLAVLIASVLQ